MTIARSARRRLFSLLSISTARRDDGVRGGAGRLRGRLSIPSSRGWEFLFEYRIDIPSDQGTSRPLSGRDVLPVKQRLCLGQNVVFGIVGGQDSEACKDLMRKRK